MKESVVSLCLSATLKQKPSNYFNEYPETKKTTKHVGSLEMFLWDSAS